MKVTTRLRSTAIATAALLLIPIAGCAASSPEDQSFQASSTLSLGIDEDMAVKGYDPLRTSGQQRLFFESLYDTLFELGDDGSTQPGLATAATYNEDNTVLTLTLDTSATFADGSTLDAELVKANLDRRPDPELDSYRPIAEEGAQELVSVDVIGEDEVALTFVEPQPGFETNLTGLMGMIVGPAGIADGDALDAAPDGSGPYALDAQGTVKGNKYVLSKKADYPDAAEFAYDTVTYNVIVDAQARANALISGQIDVAPIASANVDFVSEREREVAQIGGTIINLLAFDKTGQHAEAFAKQEVREALQYAVNREALVDALHPGDLPAWNALPASSAGFDEAFNDKYAYDPVKAKEMLAQAGYPDGISFEMIASAQTQTDLQAIQKDFAEAGIDMAVTVASSTDQLFAAVRTTPLGYNPVSWANPVGTMYGIVLTGYANIQGASDAELSDITAQLAAATTPEEEAEALTALNARLLESGWLIPLYETLTNYGYDAAKVQPIEFAGANVQPRLASIKPVD
ncbi:ABC transporter substrate-binding protein [Microbacterium sp. A196]|uniref:ABC transporter substrate-binding protein n=1 Tax=Microbacterium sp. A196 TaxID=3457320 RepID=UPI003FD0C0D4